MIIEPSALVRTSLRDLVRTVRGAVVVFETAPALIALERCRELEPDLVVLSTPRAGEALRFLARAEGLSPRPRIVVLAPFVAAPLRERCMALGADGIFDTVEGIDHFVARLHELAEDAS